MIINGKEFDFDIADADCMERYENALQEMQESSKNMQIVASNAEMLRKTCQLVHDFFDKVLGENAANTLFDGKMNFRVCFQVYEEFVNACTEECQELTNALSKYSSNRAQRRAK